jgi:ADP-ribosylglycohydrolase
LIGGAAGDALGYPVEFMTLDEIYGRYPGTGITAYNLDNELGKGLISDDTQMTLFTAQGILVGATRGKLRGISAPMESYIYRAYLSWLLTQTGKDVTQKRQPCWLTEIKELCVPRAPGNTCISALLSERMGTMEEPINDSKGCGGVMRVAPTNMPCAVNRVICVSSEMRPLPSSLSRLYTVMPVPG